MNLFQKFSRLMGMHNKQPFLCENSEYWVFYQSERLAKLSDPFIPDQFWIEFLLTPQTQERVLLDKLYSDAFWHSNDIRIIDISAQRPVQFLLALNFANTTEEQIIDFFDGPKEQVVLRGPYAPPGVNLPYFVYHPDPVATGSIQVSENFCECCNKARGYVYTSMIYAVDEIESICPWCIANGKAAHKFNDIFNDTVKGNVPAKIESQLKKNTPSYHSWQEPIWLTCCQDACEFLGYPKQEELINLTAAQLGYKLPAETLSNYQSKPYNNPGIYKFKCRHCNQYYYNIDFQ